jgi:hypothetical protein
VPTKQPSPHWMTRSAWKTGEMRTVRAVTLRLMAAVSALKTGPAKVTMAQEMIPSSEPTAPASSCG